MGIKELIAKLEKATGPDRALGDEVLLACGWHTDSNDDGEILGWYDRHGIMYSSFDRPDPTQSIDAARKLIPSRHGWFIEDTTLMFLSQVYRLIDIDLPAKRFDGESDHAAIALCIAALKAREDRP